MKRIVHTTKLKIDRQVLADSIAQAKKDFVAVNDPTRKTKEGRSLFSRYNNMNHMYERLFDIFSSEDSITVETVGEAEPDACARVYYRPSFTSQPADFRRAVVPLNPSHKFLFFDLKAAEFFLSCYFAGEVEVVDAYLRGEDPYDNLASFFPPGTPRKHYKTTLLASIYGGTPYTTAKRLGLSEAQATRLHNSVYRALPSLERFKSQLISWAHANGCYRYPTNLMQTEYQHVHYKEIKKTKQVGFSPNLALSVYTQSALGAIMQQVIADVELLKPKGTFLTVFDSVLIEAPEEDFRELEDFFTERFYPFRIDAFKTGSSFYEAYK